MIDDKQMEDVEYFNYLGAILTNDGKSTSCSKYRIPMAKADFKKKTSHFFNLNFCGAATWTLRRVPQNCVKNFEMLY